MRLIDADAFVAEINSRIKAAIEWAKECEMKEDITIRAEQAIATFCEASLTAKKMPTIDAVPVVRCKDCKYAETIENEDIYCHSYGGVLTNNPEWYCASGERQAEE